MIRFASGWALRTSEYTDRIARTAMNVVICRTFVRSVFFITTRHGDGCIDRSLQIATTHRPLRISSVCRSFMLYAVTAVDAVDTLECFLDSLYCKEKCASACIFLPRQFPYTRMFPFEQYSEACFRRACYSHASYGW
jgi:hypothetical protein